jgi:hypothetical protein
MPGGVWHRITLGRRTLRKVCTPKEWAAFKRLEVVTAAAYLRGDRVGDAAAWCERVLADDCHAPRRLRPGSPPDERTRAWYGVPLENFVGRLADERKRYKRQARDPSLGEEDRALAQGLDALMKLMVNTVYGDFVARYFQVGNTVLGNNITARGRVGIWLVAKALGLRQCITDGGIYTPDRVPTFKGRKPGLATLSRPWEWQDFKNGRRGYIALPGFSWGDLSNVDALALDYVNRFWGPYGLTLPFKLEHKLDNTFTEAAYWSKADYALRLAKPRVNRKTGQAEPVEYKLRGKDRHRDRHPSFVLMDNVLAGRDEFPTDLKFKRGGIMKIGKWKQVQGSKGFAGQRGLRPGDNLPEEEHTARYNNTHFPVRDEAEYARRRNRNKTHRGKYVFWFEKFGYRGISGVHREMARDKLTGKSRGVCGRARDRTIGRRTHQPPHK